MLHVTLQLHFPKAQYNSNQKIKETMKKKNYFNRLKHEIKLNNIQ
jgi:hypothetical protein